MSVPLFLPACNVLKHIYLHLKNIYDLIGKVVCMESTLSWYMTHRIITHYIFIEVSTIAIII